MRKILLSLITIVVVSAAVVKGTQALFSDTETSTGNTFAAGTLDLNLEGNDIDVAIFNVTDAKPGDSGADVWTVDNVGTINGYLDLHSLTLTDDDNSCNEPEGLVDGSCGAGEGELSANMTVNLFIDVNGDGIFDVVDGDTTIYGGALSGIASDYDQDIPLDAGDTKYISLAWEISALTDNAIQSDSTQLDTTFELGQDPTQ